MLLAASHRERETELRPAPARRARNQRATEQLRRAAARPAAMVDRLENRRLLSVLTVTNANDVGAGSLRAAISAAGAGDTIQFASSLAGATISLTQEFQITKPIAITGLGASQLTLDATHNINNGVFQVDQTAWGTVISGLTISNAFNGVSGGAAVYAKTTVTLTDCTFSDNLGGYGLGINGGTVYFDGSYGGTLTVSGCTFAGNDCAISGAIGYSGAGGTDSLVVDHCSFYNNSAAIAASHGNTSIRDCAIASGGPNWAAISNSDGTMVITGSTISGNGSGGLRNEGSGTLTVINSTIFGNEAHKGGGIYNNSNLTVRNSTICGNSADSAGGGIYTPSWAMATLYNTIIANNYNATSPDVSGPVTAHNCLVGNTLGAQILPAIGGNNLLDQDALVAPLGSYGGSTQTMPPLLGSPAIDRGDNIYIPSGVTTDQRGLQRIFNSTVDIGACEYQGPAPDIAVSYNGQNIVDGDSTPSTADGTDFGTSASPVDRTFTVTNAGSATLTLSGLTVPSGFSIVNGLSSSLAPGASDTFTVRFLATGNASGLVSFANNDSNENPFNFSVVGTRLPGSNLPLAPRNLTATPFSTTRVDLSWTDRSSNEDGFWVEVRDDTAGGGWQRYKNCAQNTSSCAVRTLYDNSLYSFRVCSYTAGGASAWAQVLSVKTPDNGSLATAGDRGNAPVRPHVKDVEDRIGPADPRDYFKYRMAYAGKLKVVLDDLTAGEGVNVKLMRLNANGTTTQVGFASTATRDNPTIQTGWIAAGNYFVRVQQNSAGDATDYRLMVLADYAGESMTRAHPIVVPPGGARNGWIGDGDVQDWYRFNLGSAGKVRINLSGLSDDLDVKLLDSAGSQISRSELGGSSAEEIETSLGAGRYYIVVYAPSGESSGYRLGVGLA